MISEVGGKGEALGGRGSFIIFVVNRRLRK